MGTAEPESPTGLSKVDQSLHGLRQRLACILGVAAGDLSPSRRFADLIPQHDRRRIWQQLRGAGVDLPELRLSNRVYMTTAALVLFPVALLSFLLHWSMALSVIELGILARKVTRPWATCPPSGCESLREAALHVTHFALPDYRAGLWSHEEIAGKVRLIISRNVGTPFDSISDEMPLIKILGC